MLAPAAQPGCCCELLVCLLAAGLVRCLLLLAAWQEMSPVLTLIGSATCCCPVPAGPLNAVSVHYVHLFVALHQTAPQLRQLLQFLRLGR